jgi:hypothetical protein
MLYFYNFFMNFLVYNELLLLEQITFQEKEGSLSFIIFLFYIIQESSNYLCLSFNVLLNPQIFLFQILVILIFQDVYCKLHICVFFSSIFAAFLLYSIFPKLVYIFHFSLPPLPSPP